MSFNEIPFVSVIIPVYNGIKSVEKCFLALSEQDYPKEKLEIIFVDNGSSDGTVRLLNNLGANVIEEKEIRGSYAARNKGIKEVKGSILAFTDIDCVPNSDWVSKGVEFLERSEKDMAGGKISFIFSAEKTASEIADSLINLDNKKSVLKTGTAKTANLFTKKDVFEKAGLFDEKMISGGDIEWTKRAVRAGASIGFAEEAVVMHEARKFSELVKKHFRVGQGSIQSWRGQGRSFLWIIARWFSLFIPNINFPSVQIIAIVYVCKVSSALGTIYSLINKRP